MKDPPLKGQTDGAVLQVRRIGNSVGVILPKDLLARLNLKEGDKLQVIEQSERGLKLTPYDPKHAKAIEIERRAFRTYANTFKALAKMKEPEWLTVEIALDILAPTAPEGRRARPGSSEACSNPAASRISRDRRAGPSHRR